MNSYQLTTDHPASRDGVPIPNIPTTAIDFDDILVQAFGPVEDLGRIAKSLVDSESFDREDIRSVGHIAKLLYYHGVTRFFELLEQSERAAARQAAE